MAFKAKNINDIKTGLGGHKLTKKDNQQHYLICYALIFTLQNKVGLFLLSRQK